MVGVLVGFSIDPARILYLAVPHFVYQTFFNLAFIHKIVQRSQLKLLIYNLEHEVIERWIE
jgi:hypothetical protein